MDLTNSYDIPKEDAEDLVEIAEDEGFEDIDSLVQRFIVSSVMPGCCKTCRSITTRVEPDQRAGWCHNCGKQTVRSVLVLAGMA